MKKQDMMRRITHAFDDFIVGTGGNIDPRACSNRDRIALIRFWRNMIALHHDSYARIEIDDCFREILQKKLTSHNFTQSKQSYVVLDPLGNEKKKPDKVPKERTTGT